MPEPSQSRPPRSEVEQSISEIWSELLHVDVIELDDNFFDLGGNSMLALQATFKLRELAQRMGTELPTVKLFEFPTVRTLAGFLSGESSSKPQRETAPEQVAARRQRRRTLRQARAQRLPATVRVEQTSSTKDRG